VNVRQCDGRFSERPHDDVLARLRRLTGSEHGRLAPCLLGTPPPPPPAAAAAAAAASRNSSTNDNRA